MSAKEFLVTLNVSPELEEPMVDCLLTFESEHGFSSMPVFSHDHRNAGLSLAEQVTIAVVFSTAEGVTGPEISGAISSASVTVTVTDWSTVLPAVSVARITTR